MSDGHTRLKGNDFDEQQSRHYKLRMSFNEEGNGRRVFVIHASSAVSFLSGFHPLDFLEGIGFQKSRVSCPFYHDNCLYLKTWELPRGEFGFHRETEYAHEEFRRLLQDLDEMYVKQREVCQKLSRHMTIFPLAGRYKDQGPQLLDLRGKSPGWLEAIKVDEHWQLEKTLKETSERLSHFDQICHSIWGTGDDLVDSIHLLLSDLGFEVNKTGKGFTVDLMAHYPGVGKFALEVTGLNDAVKKKSPKIGQTLNFLQQHRVDEKIVILANTFNNLPIEERTKREQFTEDAIEIITPLKISGMTTVDLYQMWKSIKFDKKTVREVFGPLFNHAGGLFSFCAT